MRENKQADRPANIIGIALGEVEVRVARLNEEGEPEITYNAEKSEATPAVIQFEDSGDVIVGTEAKKFLSTGTPNVFAEFRRVIGDPGKSWRVGGKEITPADLSALLLKKVVDDYAAQFGQPDSIAISWPANFRNEQRVATKEAAAKAGLKVEHYIEEPVAAALFYSTQNSLNGKYLVYDFGGDTFDVTLFEAQGKEIKILHQEGVQQLGGKDLDNALLKIIGEKFRERTGDEFDAIDCNYDKLAVESDMQTLSTRPSVLIRVVTCKHGPIAIEVSRNEFEAGISYLISQAELACENVLKCGQTDASKYVKKSDIKEIFMTGATSSVPATQASVERLFGKKPKVKNPAQAVAMGAAIFAALKSSGNTLNTGQSNAVNDIQVANVAPHFYGIVYTNWLTGESTNITVIRKGESLPARRTYKVRTDSRGYLPTLSLTESVIEETNPDYVTVIWSGVLQCSAPSSEVEMIFFNDDHGIMSVSMTEVATGKCIKVDLRPT